LNLSALVTTWRDREGKPTALSRQEAWNGGPGEGAALSSPGPMEATPGDMIAPPSDRTTPIRHTGSLAMSDDHRATVRAGGSGDLSPHTDPGEGSIALLRRLAPPVPWNAPW
jgi:hypothetical protein